MSDDPRELTFEQVKKVGRFAEHEGAGLIFYVPKYCVEFDWQRNDNPCDDEIPDTGWHHLPDCPCEFCAK